jgi:pimeloyl-ACP methyl ester carboxylesterase
LEGRAEQAGAALEWLRGAEGIDGRRAGIWGHSQGGWLVQMLAARDPDLAFAIANSGSAIGIERQDFYAWEQTLRAGGAADQDVAAALAFLRSVQEATRRGDDFATVEERLVRAARGQSWYGYLELEDAVDWGHERRFIEEAYEPLEALARVRCPYLAVFGALDVLIPVWESARMCGQALRDAGNRDATVVVYPQGNHRIQLEETRQFVPGYLDLLGEWALSRVTAP